MAETQISTCELTSACLFRDTVATAHPGGNSDSNQSLLDELVELLLDFQTLNIEQLEELPPCEIADLPEPESIKTTKCSQPSPRAFQVPTPHLPQCARPDLAHRRTEIFSPCAMITISIRATYTEQTALDAFFSELFGYGKASVLWKRGRFQCNIPRKLSQIEQQLLDKTVYAEHYR